MKSCVGECDTDVWVLGTAEGLEADQACPPWAKVDLCSSQGRFSLFAVEGRILLIFFKSSCF